MMTIDYLGIGKRLKLARKRRRMTQSDLARASGISVSFLGHLERGTRKASAETLAALCEVLEMDLHYLVLGQGSASGQDLVLIWQRVCALERDLRAMLPR